MEWDQLSIGEQCLERIFDHFETENQDEIRTCSYRCCHRATRYNFAIKIKDRKNKSSQYFEEIHYGFMIDP